MTNRTFLLTDGIRNLMSDITPVHLQTVKVDSSLLTTPVNDIDGIRIVSESPLFINTQTN